MKKNGYIHWVCVCVLYALQPTEGNSLALLAHDHCRYCLSNPSQFHNCPDIVTAADRRNCDKMFQNAMSTDIESGNEERIVRLLEYDWFIDPIEQHPFVDHESPIPFDPYMLPRCIDHDVSEGIIQYVTDNIFIKQCGPNMADRHRKCMLLSQSLTWFPGASSDKLHKIVSVRNKSLKEFGFSMKQHTTALCSFILILIFNCTV